jgi:hypothetical protein
MVVGMASSFLFIAILIIVSILCIIFLTAYHKKLKVKNTNIKKYHKKLVLAYCFSILVSLSIFGLSFALFIILTVISILCIIYLIAYDIKLKAKNVNTENHHTKLALAYTFSILISSLIVGISFEYCFNYDFNLEVNSRCFPDRYCKVCFNDKYSNDSYTVTLCFPPNSVYCYKTPELVYYNSNSIDECIKFMDDELKLEKKDSNILDYRYANNMYIINCENSRTINIKFYKDTDNETRFIISYFE